MCASIVITHSLHIRELKLFQMKDICRIRQGHDLCESIRFPGYIEKVEKDQQKTGLNEAVVTGTSELDGIKYGVAVMDARFRMGSMGSVVGEKSAEL